MISITGWSSELVRWAGSISTGRQQSLAVLWRWVMVQQGLLRLSTESLSPGRQGRVKFSLQPSPWWQCPSLCHTSTVWWGICSAAPGTVSRSRKFCLVTPRCWFSGNLKARFSLEVLLTPFSSARVNNKEVISVSVNMFFFMSWLLGVHYMPCRHRLRCLTKTLSTNTGIFLLLKECWVAQDRHQESVLPFPPQFQIPKNWFYVNCTFQFYKALGCESKF